MAAAGRKLGGGERKSAGRLSGGESEGKRPFGRHRRGRGDNMSGVINKK